MQLKLTEPGSTKRDGSPRPAFEIDRAVQCNCEPVRYLNALMLKPASIDRGLDRVARSALNIASTMRESPVSDVDLEILCDLIGAISNQGHGALLLEIQLCAPQCALCAAVARRLASRSARGFPRFPCNK